MDRTMFVARERQLAQLQGMLDAARAGKGAVCFITGEAGAGKSALVAELAWRAEEADPDLIVVSGNCNAHTGEGDPYLPFREILGLLTGDVDAKLKQGAISDANAGRLRTLLAQSIEVLVETGPDLIEVLVPGAKLIGKVTTVVMQKAGWVDKLNTLLKRKAEGLGDVMLSQNHIFEQYTNVLKALATRKPLMLVLDDLHWADASSIGLLFHLGRSIGDSRILIVGTYRPNDVALGRTVAGAVERSRHPLEPIVNEMKRYFGDITVDLSEIDKVEGRAFVDSLLDVEPNRLSKEFRDRLYWHTEGTPLFTVELLRSMQESGQLRQDGQGYWVEAPALDWNELPPRVEGVIEERIGRIEESLRSILSVASVEGEQFTAEVIARVQALEERQLLRKLSDDLDRRYRLVVAEGSTRVAAQRLSVFRFWHNLFQKYMYNQLNEVERAYLHEDVGRALASLYGERAPEIAAQLARHFELGGVPDLAVEYLTMAGGQAIRLSANTEAIEHLSRGLQLVQSMPATASAAQQAAAQELKLQVLIAVPLMLTGGWASPRVGSAYQRAHELCQELGQSPELFPTLVGVLTYYLVRGQYEMAYQMAESNWQVAERSGDPELMLEARQDLGACCLYTGRLIEVRGHMEEVIRLYDPPRHAHHAFVYGKNPAVTALSQLGGVLTAMGYPDEGLRRASEAVELAETWMHPFSYIWALSGRGITYQLRGDVELMRAAALAVIGEAKPRDFLNWIAQGLVWLGWTSAVLGEPEQGIAEIQQGLGLWQMTGSELMKAYFFVLLADAFVRGGQVPGAMQALDDAEAHVARTGEHWMEPEIYRIRGDAFLAQTRPDAQGAESSFEQALASARGQEARLLELRAAESLARLWQSQGRGADALALLEPVMEWFREGLDAPNVASARALLDGLRAARTPQDAKGRRQNAPEVAV